MADVDPGDVLRIGAGLSFQGTYDVVNVYHVLADNVVGTTWAIAVTAIQAYMDALYTFIKPTLTDLMGTNILTVANVTQGTTIGSVAWSPGWAGADTSEASAPGVACFSWIRTYTPRVQIRKYFGVFGEGNMTDGVFSTAVQTACTNAMNYHRLPRVLTGGWTFTGVAWNRTLLTYTTGVSEDSSAEPAYQRRRKRGRGS